MHPASSESYDAGSGRHTCPSGSASGEMSQRRSPNAGRLRKGRGKGRVKSRLSGEQSSLLQPETSVTSRLRSRRAGGSTSGSDGASTKHTNGVSCNGSLNNVIHKDGKGALPKKPPTFSDTDLEIVRLIGQHLRNLGLEWVNVGYFFMANCFTCYSLDVYVHVNFCGFRSSAEELMNESGCRLDHAAAAKFRSHVMNGEWESVSHPSLFRTHVQFLKIKPLLFSVTGPSVSKRSFIVCARRRWSSGNHAFFVHVLLERFKFCSPIAS